MTEVRTMLSLANEYLAERRRLGFDLTIPGGLIVAFARFVDATGHTGTLTAGVVLDWVQGKATRAAPLTWARRLRILRPFARYLTRLDPATKFPMAHIFGPEHPRLTPHIYSDAEIGELLAAARRLPPAGTLRPITYETIFGPIAASGLRISEVLNLCWGDVDVARRLLTVQQTK